MSDCQKLEPLLTPYVDGETPGAEGAAVDAHLRACSPCRARVDAERAVRTLLRDRRGSLGCAPLALREKCRAALPSPSTSTRSAARRPSPHTWRTRAMPLALAASLTLLIGGAFVYQATSRSSRVLAAELAADHVKCFAVNRIAGIRGDRPAAVRTYLASSFGWDANLPQMEGLNLEAARPCLYGEGRAAHVMYRYDGRPISLFMLPGTARREELVEVMGHEAAIWSVDGRTFVLIARESRAEMERLVAALHDSLR